MPNLKYIGKNILDNELEVRNGNIIGDHTEVIRVTVVSDGGNKYAFEGATTPDFTIDEGKTYRFDQSDSTNDGHPFRFSITENGTWGGGSTYSTGVTTHGTPGVKGAYTEINVTKVTPNHLYYYCTAHSGMGNDALLLKNDFSNLHRVSGSSVSTGSFGTIQTTTGTIPTLIGNTTFRDNLTVTGNLDVSDTIYHTGDSNTKIRFPEVDTIAFNTSGIERLRIDASGHITASGELAIGNNEKLYLNKTEDTYIQSMAGDIARVVAGGNQMLLLDYDTGNRAVFGNGTKVYIGSDNNKQPDKALVVDGDISGSSSSTGSFGAGHFADKLGIGTVSIPHGGVGGGRLSINGADSNVSNGPALQMTTDSDNYPLFSVLPYSHDNIAVYFDGYNEGGGNKSSDAGSNYRIHKISDELRFGVDSGVSAGSTATYENILVFDTSKNIEIGGNISGSSTSTGSFGSLVVADKVQGNINFGGTTNIFRTTTADQYTTVRIDQGTAQYNGKLHFGGLLAGNADYLIGEIGGIWNYNTSVNPVSLIRFETGDDTTNRDDGRITFWTSAASRNPVERMRIDNDGNVGIGTTAPYYKAHISFDNSTTAFSGGSNGNWGGDGLRIENTNSTADTKATLQLRAYDYDALISAVKKSGANEGEVHFNVDPNLNTNQLLTLAGSKISGSAASTGSFGHIETPGNLEVAGTGSFNVVSASVYLGQVGARFVFSQGTPSSTWSINHNLGLQHPNVTVYNSDDQIVIPQSVTADGGTSMTITFSEPVAGSATLSTGGASSNITGRTFMFGQSSPSPLWRVTHSLGERYPAVTVYDEADNVIIPERIHASSTGNAEIYFQDPTSGNAHFSVGNGLPGVNPSNAGNFMRVNEDGTQIEYVTSAISDVTGSLPISGSINITGSVFTTGDVIAGGDIVGQNYIVQSSVTQVTMSFNSGSTIFGDTTDDTHQFTGSIGILHAGANESQTGLSIKNSQGSNNSSARLLLQGNGGDFGTIGTIASRNTNASYDDVDYARIKFALPGSSMTTHGIEFHTGDGGAATKKFEIHGTKISGSSSSTGSFGSLSLAGKVQSNLRMAGTNLLYIGDDNTYIQDVGSYIKLRIADGHYFTIQNDSGDTERFRLADNGSIKLTSNATSTYGLYAYNNAVHTGTGASSLVALELDNASATGTTLDVRNDGTGDLLTLRATTTEVFNVSTSGDMTIAGNAHQFTGSLFLTGSRIDFVDGKNNTSVGFEAGKNITTGYQNVAIGAFTGDAITTGQNNTALGYAALSAEDTGTRNVAIGNEALKVLNYDGAGYNVAVGHRAGYALTTGTVNTFIGAFAGGATDDGTRNVVLGYAAMDTGNAGDDNIAIGYGALQDTTASGNIAIGSSAMIQHTTGVRNIAIGQFAMGDTDAGSTSLGSQDNIFMGYNAGGGTWADAASNNNVAIGSLAMDAALNGALYNVAVGVSTLSALTSGDNMVAIGQGALQEQTTGEGNVAIGRAAMNVHGTGGYNTAIGNFAMDDTNAGSTSAGSTHNIFIGNSAGGGTWANAASNYNVGIGNYSMDAALNGALNNTALGHYTLSSLTEGDSNVAIGYNAGGSLTTGGTNILIGRNAGSSGTDLAYSVIIGTYAGDAINTNNSQGSVLIGYEAGTNLTDGVNSLIGYYAGRYLSTQGYNTMYGYEVGQYMNGSSNTFIGYYAGRGSSTSAPYGNGGNNVALGREALKAISSGSYNVAIGRDSLKIATDGDHNIALGYSSGVALTSGDDNVLIGKNTAINLSTGTNNIAIGENALYLENSGTYAIAIGYRAGYKNRISGTNYNTFMGYNAGREVSTGNHNTFLGNHAGYGVDGSDADNNVAIGSYSLVNIMGNNTIGIGYESGRYASGSHNTFVGYASGKGGTTSEPFSSGEYNVGVGYQSLDAFTTGFRNVGVGKDTLGLLTTGQKNTAIGDEAFFTLGKGNYSVAVGAAAGYYATGSYNTFMGYEAGKGGTSSAPHSSGEYNTAIGYNALKGFTTANYNTAIGHEAGEAITSGIGNAFLGFRAGLSATTADYSVGIGYGALGDATLTGNYNIGIGLNAGMDLTSGAGNIILGYNAGDAMTGTSYTVLIGQLAGSAINSTDANGTVAIGYAAGASITEGARQTFLGYQAGYSSTTGDENVFIGYQAGYSETDGIGNIYIGKQVAYNIGDGNYNVAIGEEAMKSSGTAANNHATYNVAVGNQAGRNLTTGDYNVFLGSGAGKATTTVQGNIAIGYNAMSVHTTGAKNIAIGTYAMDDTNAGSTSLGSRDNIFMGYDAGGGTWVDAASSYNVAIGNYAMDGALDGADNNVAIGYNAGGAHTTGDNNVWVGKEAGESGTYHVSCVGVGQGALGRLSGSYNTAIGADSLTGNQGGGATASSRNTAVGYQALRQVGQGTAGANQENTAIGYQAGDVLTTSAYNVFVGAHAGGTVTTGGSLVMLGHGADPSGNTTSGEIVIGYNATGIGSNYAVIGSGDITRVYMSQDGDAVMYADGTINTSDRRTKQNIEKLNIGLDFINKLNPVTYNKRQLSDYDDSLKEKLPWHIRGEEPAILADEEISKSRVGFIAQDVGEALEELGFDSNNDIVEVDDKTEKQHLDYAKFVPALVKSVQELTEENKRLQDKLNDLEIFIMDKLGDDK